MAKETIEKVANDFFTRYPKETKVYITSDGQAFVEELFAKNHAKKKELDVKAFRKGETTSEDLTTLDRAALEAYVKGNSLTVDFTEETTDEALRALILATESGATTGKETTKKDK